MPTAAIHDLPPETLHRHQSSSSGDRRPHRRSAIRGRSPPNSNQCGGSVPAGNHGRLYGGIVRQPQCVPAIEERITDLSSSRNLNVHHYPISQDSVFPPIPIVDMSSCCL
ncbi:hypothetical protein CDAR_411241 [Caerostris darwini]|uniref:Uncharacterized protein n=1 Tax=Caerostris darwini TaxID=1538125 RepID=A0AAV4SDG7_9ARAC|nr:hypothetical protein CDAR_411241 [Caerostris darwini]